MDHDFKEEIDPILDGDLLEEIEGENFSEENSDTYREEPGFPQMVLSIRRLSNYLCLCCFVHA